MGKQIAPDDAMFKGEAGAAHVDLVDVNLEGGENRVDVDLFAEPDEKPAGLDLEFTSGERKAPCRLPAAVRPGLPARRAEARSRRSRPRIGRRTDARIRPAVAHAGDADHRVAADRSRLADDARAHDPRQVRRARRPDQTAELSLDDLGLDVDSLEHSGSLEDTTSLEKDPTAEGASPLRDDEMTQLAPGLGNFDRTMKAPREKFDIETTGTIYIDQVDLGRRRHRRAAASGNGIDRGDEAPVDAEGPGPGSRSPVRFGHQSGNRAPDRGGDRDVDNFSSDVFADRTSEVPRVDLDVGEPLSADDGDATHRRTVAGGAGLSELEPVTMSEVGTKLDLARAYMDMGDPDGARSILDEVLAEGNASQKQEAQRLMESISIARIALGLEYDGSAFCGWQSQDARTGNPVGRRSALSTGRRSSGRSHGCRPHRCRRARRDAGRAFRHASCANRAQLGARREHQSARASHCCGRAKSPMPSMRASARSRAPIAT